MLRGRLVSKSVSDRIVLLYIVDSVLNHAGYLHGMYHEDGCMNLNGHNVCAGNKYPVSAAGESRLTYSGRESRDAAIVATRCYGKVGARASRKIQRICVLVPRPGKFVP